MAVVIRIGHYQATLRDDGDWESTSGSLLSLLNSSFPLEDVSPIDPDPILNHAKRVVEKIGGRIVHYSELPPLPPGAVQ